MVVKDAAVRRAARGYKVEIARLDLSDAETDRLFELPNFMNEEDIDEAKIERIAREGRLKAKH